MFFILSKVLDFLLSPLVWIMLLFLAGFIFKKPVLKKRFIYAGIILLLVFSNPFLASEAFRAWEGEPQSLSSVGYYDTGIVLTGVAFNRSSAPDRVFFSKGADRVLHTVQLYKIGKIKKIIISGGSGSLSKVRFSESSRFREVMLFCGVRDEDIYIESRSRNTMESARYSKVLTDSLQIKSKVLLITSAFHMPRSLGCFRKADLLVDEYRVDYFNGNDSFSFDNFIPNATGITKWTILIHELAGFAIYGIMGYL